MQLDNFDWVMPAGCPVDVLPRPEEADSLADIEADVCDVPDVFLETAGGGGLLPCLAFARERGTVFPGGG